MSTKAARGTKRVCQGCGAKFYDLNNDPIICPLCEAEFKIDKPTSDAEAKAKEKAEAEKAEAEKKKAAAAKETAKELDDIDPDLAAVEDEDLADIEDAEDSDSADSGDDSTDAFLPDDDDGDDDVNELIGDSIPKVDDDT